MAGNVGGYKASAGPFTGAMKPPPDKRRKTDTDDLWDDDDDMMLTQEHMIQINALEKQEMVKCDTGARSIGRGTPRSRSSGDNMTPIYNRPRTNSIGAASTTIRAPQSGGMVGRGTAGTSRTSFNLSSPMTATHTSISSDMEKIKLENERLQKQVVVMENDKMSIEGRNKILQDKLTQRESDIQRVRHEKLEQINQFTKDHNTKEQNMRQMIDKYKSELHFLQLEMKNELAKNSPAPVRPGTSNQSSLRPGNQIHVSEVRPGTCKVSPKAAYDFSEDFVPSQKPMTPKRLKLEPVTPKRVKEHSEALPLRGSPIHISRPVLPCHRSTINVSTSKGCMTGGGMVSKVLSFFVNLLGHSASQHTVHPLIADSNSGKCDSDSSSSQSPTSDTPSLSLSSLETEASVGIANAKLQQTSTMIIRTMISLQESLVTTPTSLLNSDTHAATILLPTIEDSLHTYIGVLEALQMSFSSQSGTSASNRSSDSSLEATSSGCSLPKGISAGAISVLERQVHTMLQVLKVFITYSPHVCSRIIQGYKQGTNRHRSQPDDHCCSTRTTCNILHKLCRLANPKLFHNCSSALHLCVLSLDVLAMVMEKCSEKDLDRLVVDHDLPFLDVLTSCIPGDIYVWGSGVLRLVHALSACTPAIHILCTKEDDCIFYNVYDFCVHSLTDQSEDKCFMLQYKFIGIIGTLVSHGNKMIKQILSSVCHCSEVVDQLVMILHYIYTSRCYHSNQLALHIFHAGTHLLQNFAAVDGKFLQNHENNERYIEVVYGMEHVLSKLNLDNECSCIEWLQDMRHDLSSDEDYMEIDADAETSDTMEQPPPSHHTPHSSKSSHHNSPNLASYSSPSISSHRHMDVNQFIPDPNKHSTPKSKSTTSVADNNNDRPKVQSKLGKKSKLSRVKSPPYAKQ